MNTEFENILITEYKESMIAFLKARPEFFDEAVRLAIAEKQPFSWRSAWLLWSCMDENDERLKKYISKLINAIDGKKDGHQRELLKILSKMELNENHFGKLFNVCVNIWESINKRPSVRFTAFKMIEKIADKHYELRNEIIFLTQERYLEQLSPGIKNSLIKTFRRFQEKLID